MIFTTLTYKIKESGCECVRKLKCFQIETASKNQTS